MAANVVRSDVIQIGFKIEDSPLQKLTDELNKLKSIMSSAFGDDIFDEMTDDAKKAIEPIEEIGDAAKKAKEPLEELPEPLKDIPSPANKAYQSLKKLSNIAFDKLTAGLNKVSSMVGTVMKKAVKYAAVGIGVGAVGIGAIVGQSVSAFAEYEQLVGGVDTLFKDSSAIVQKYANDAYKTAGLSANTYMETVTSFSASLLNSLGGDTGKAAGLADVAITDMSDNANKMGTSMDTIIQTYQSLAKGNYAMLDNLKLGYGGTKGEMEKLIKKAATLDKSVKANDMSFANMVKAIHAVQTEMEISGISYKEYTELVESGKMTQEEAFKLLGTTAKEANFTVTGSLNQVKAAWGNMLTAMVVGGDSFDQCTENLISSLEIFAGNIIPVIEGALEGVGSLITKLSPILAEKLPTIVTSLLPPLIEAAGTLLASLVRELPTIIQSLIPAIKSAAAMIVKALYEAFTGKEMSADTFSSVTSAIDKIVSVCIKGVPAILGLVAAFKAFTIGKTVVSGITKFAKGISTIASKVTGGLASKLTTTAVAQGTMGTTSATSGKQVGTAATSFMKMGVAVLAIGGGLALAGVGFALLTQSAIALANAGGVAIAVMVGMVAAIALLAVGAAAIGAALTAGAVGFIAFGAAVLMVGAGFALIGVAALLAANALSIITGLLPPITQYGLMGAVSIAALGVSLYVFAAGAAVAGVATLILGAGLVVLATGLTLAAVGLLAVSVPLALISALFTLLAVVTTPLASNITTIALSFSLMLASSLLLAAELPLLAGAFTLVLVPVKLLKKPMSSLGEAFAEAAAGASTMASSMTIISTTLFTVSSGFVMLVAITNKSMNAIIQLSKSGANGIMSAFARVKLNTVGSQMLNGLIIGMNSKKAAAVAAARSIAQAINAEYRKVQDINSPSGVWEKYGGYQIEGDIKGMENKLPQLKSTVQEVGKVAAPQSKYTPDNSVSYSNNRTNNSEYNTYAPQFSFTISGNGDSRAIARQTKRAVKEAMNEMFESMSRRDPQLQMI